ncbi:MAG: PD-(D/E)XK nuclease family protein [Dysgonamonadaceae bacterium]|jgi:hypothetical protein|nr:PD-(D/E)XK nuclease family protein [Dysgonamonadaceae bacterium]
MTSEISSIPFLQQVAEDVVKRFGGRLADLVMVFPNRRARLFFNNYLYRALNRPLWTPQYTSVEELFASLSPLRKADPVGLIGELYRVYTAIHDEKSAEPSTETLDDFYFFGEILLNDFDDIDKNLINARLLFSNLNDLDRLKDDFGHLSENQIAALVRRFGSAFSGESRLKTEFWAVWNILGEVYTAFRENLRKGNMAYDGMLMRDVIENENLEIPGSQFAFVGFNVLNKCEETLFKRLKDKALFYWDYDPWYLKLPAGKFIEENIRRFGSALPEPPSHSFSSPKNITFLASPSESGQAGSIPQWLDSLKLPPSEVNADSAIVLCNEKILPLVMHSVSPEKAENINITMGFPVMQTPIASFIRLLGDLQVKGAASRGVFRYKFVLQALRHAYAGLVFPEAEEIERQISEENIFFPDVNFLKNNILFTQPEKTADLCKYLLDITEMVGKSFKSDAENGDIYEDLYQESIFKAWQILNRLYGLLTGGNMQLEKPTFLRLLRKLLSTTQIPFHGEPVKGLQIMGVLETRTLDFKNLLIMSVNEGFMPGSSGENTFIPQFLRSELGLNTIDKQDSVYAYYFYRLLQRAENITLVYSVDKNGTGKSEMSRFMLQMLVSQDIKIKRFSLQSAIKPMEAENLSIRKTDEIMRTLHERYDFNTNSGAWSLSPSALNIFIDCPLQFYLKKVKGLEAPEEMSDEMDSSVFGTIFHHAAEAVYRSFGENVAKEQIAVYLQNDGDLKIQRVVSKAFEEVYFKRENVYLKQYNGEQMINHRVICKMLKNLLEYDYERAPFRTVGLEQRFYDFFELPGIGVKLKVGGIIDRLEEQNGNLYVFDYKTGGYAKTFREISELFEAKEGRPSHIFQTFLYSTILVRKGISSLPTLPALLYIQELSRENSDFSPVVVINKEPISDFRDICGEFQDAFLQKAAELFNPQIPFYQTDVEKTCEYCDFRGYCKR